MKVRRKKNDIIFSQLIRRRDLRCQCCASQKNLDCAHIVSRRHVATRWHPRNAIALCRGCHIFFTGHPFDWTDFCREKLGGDFIAELRQVANKPVKWTTAQREEIYQHMKDELKSQEEGAKFAQHELMHDFENVS